MCLKCKPKFCTMWYSTMRPSYTRVSEALRTSCALRSRSCASASRARCPSGISASTSCEAHSDKRKHRAGFLALLLWKMSVNSQGAGNPRWLRRALPDRGVCGPESRQRPSPPGAGRAAAGRLCVVDQKRFEVPLQASRRGRWGEAKAKGKLRAPGDPRASGGGSAAVWRVRHVGELAACVRVHPSRKSSGTVCHFRALPRSPAGRSSPRWWCPGQGSSRQCCAACPAWLSSPLCSSAGPLPPSSHPMWSPCWRGTSSPSSPTSGEAGAAVGTGEVPRRTLGYEASPQHGKSEGNAAPPAPRLLPPAARLRGSPEEETQRWQWRGGRAGTRCAVCACHSSQLQHPGLSESSSNRTLMDVVERTWNSFLLEPKYAAGPILAKLKE